MRLQFPLHEQPELPIEEQCTMNSLPIDEQCTMRLQFLLHEQPEEDTNALGQAFEGDSRGPMWAPAGCSAALRLEGWLVNFYLPEERALLLVASYVFLSSPEKVPSSVFLPSC